MHFHDPELIPPCLILSLLGYRVIYDVHEDVPRQILAKAWLPRPLRRPVGWLFAGVEWVAGRVFTGVVAATPLIARRFPAGKIAVVQNFPILSELAPAEAIPYARRPPDFVYVGAIEAIRGAREMVRALVHLPESGGARLQLAGAIRPDALEAEMRADAAWSRVVFHGWAGRAKIADLLGGARAGLVVLHPEGGYPDAYPVKMFEYMACGLPVIASDFPLWRRIIDEARCGLLVDPLDPKAIASAMQWILDHPEEAERMGERGRAAVEERYNWGHEGEKLLDFYRRLLSMDGTCREL
ncbi:glycosyltransferase family 4 protein [Halofilum ochraceum]|uniref:glycosyltransferase family 4 protein n=1 Tax=Halofilum ochraceum TaxID=1611323 RepID=UPI001FE190E0|nr:glycosyltransferase family 4 protein [Halofilum ochraceum]